MRSATGIRTAAIAVAFVFGASAAQAAEPFTLRSATLEDGGTLQQKNAGDLAGNANCTGQNISPPLAWSGAPEGTRSFALVVIDTEGGAGLGSVHLVAYGIAPDRTGFAEGEIGKPTDLFVGGKNGRGVGYYSGPCPPPGGWHHYAFTLIATDLEPKALPAGLSRDDLFTALRGHAKAAAGLVARFKHQ